MKNWIEILTDILVTLSVFGGLFFWVFLGCLITQLIKPKYNPEITPTNCTRAGNIERIADFKLIEFYEDGCVKVVHPK